MKVSVEENSRVQRRARAKVPRRRGAAAPLIGPGYLAYSLDEAVFARFGAASEAYHEQPLQRQRKRGDLSSPEVTIERASLFGHLAAVLPRFAVFVKFPHTHIPPQDIKIWCL